MESQLISPREEQDRQQGLHQSPPQLAPADTKQPSCPLATAQPSFQLSAQAYSQEPFCKVQKKPVPRHMFTFVPVRPATLTVYGISTVTAAQLALFPKDLVSF